MEPIYVIVRNILVPLLWLLFRFRFFGLSKIPKSGPVIIAPNHISNFDPFCTAYLVVRAGRRPRFMAKASLWKKWYTRIVFEGANQIPVERGTGDRTPTLKAEDALRRGEALVLYPESTITTNADLTPMAGKTGIARIALATGAPIYPIGMWGAQWVAGKGRKTTYWRHNKVWMSVGDPLTFPEYVGKQDDPAILREVTDRVMSEIEELVSELQKIHPLGAAVPDFLEKR